MRWNTYELSVEFGQARLALAIKDQYSVDHLGSNRLDICPALCVVIISGSVPPGQSCDDDVN